MKKILIIEDNTEIRENIQELLELEGFSVHVAENGQSGLRSASEITPHVIVCDIMMPLMNGYEFLENIKSDSALNTTPLIFLSAKTESRDLQVAMEKGAFAYIKKPFGSEELLNTIRKATDLTNL